MTTVSRGVRGHLGPITIYADITHTGVVSVSAVCTSDMRQDRPLAKGIE